MPDQTHIWSQPFYGPFYSITRMLVNTLSVPPEFVTFELLNLYNLIKIKFYIFFLIVL